MVISAILVLAIDWPVRRQSPVVHYWTISEIKCNKNYCLFQFSNDSVLVLLTLLSYYHFIEKFICYLQFLTESTSAFTWYERFFIFFVKLCRAKADALKRTLTYLTHFSRKNNARTNYACMCNNCALCNINIHYRIHIIQYTVYICRYIFVSFVFHVKIMQFLQKCINYYSNFSHNYSLWYEANHIKNIWLEITHVFMYDYRHAYIICTYRYTYAVCTLHISYICI